ncbi:uncharacterized protein [Antedon mediterranea]|uniref:uncharacterized protein n=1 Tax=Antedon mediterranea TaxID=105859 RepID=UPI003AF44A90
MNLTAALLFGMLLLVASCSGRRYARPKSIKDLKAFRKYALANKKQIIARGGRLNLQDLEAMGLGKQVAKEQVEEDKTTVSCWLRPIGEKYPGSLFHLNCTEDGIHYFDKQCSEDRCWCLDTDGYRIEEGGPDDDGYHYKIADGLSLKCPRHRIKYA